MKLPYFVSWSGGKDSCLALHEVAERYGKPTHLLTMMTEEGHRSRSHGLIKSVIEAQATALSAMPLFVNTSWQNYDESFYQALKVLYKKGVQAGIFGDIKISGDPTYSCHRRWADAVCEKANVECLEPLWKENLTELMIKFLDSGIKAIIVAANSAIFSNEILGQELTGSLFESFIARNVHPLGERGEYHTLVVDAPLFSHPLSYISKDKVLREGYWFLDVDLQ